jgi:hypothetical protein
MEIYRDFKELLELLNAHKVEYADLTTPENINNSFSGRNKDV